MCGCPCCQSGEPSCFKPDLMTDRGSYLGWSCKCPCRWCIGRVIDGAMAFGYGNAMDDGWGGDHANHR